jgi:hypothetical protein
MKRYDIASMETFPGASNDHANRGSPHPSRLRRPAVVLLGVSFLIVAALRYAHMSDQTLGDETAWFAGLFFLGSICLSLMAGPRGLKGHWAEVWSTRVFLAGIAILAAATVGIFVDLH